MSNTDLMELREHLERMEEQSQHAAKVYADSDAPRFSEHLVTMANMYHRWIAALDEVMAVKS